MEPPNNLSPTDRRVLLRLVDATVNRTAEGLRVLEDYFRFIGDQPQATHLLKELRHAVRQAVAPWSGELLTARDTDGDVGRTVTTPTEVTRGSLPETAWANWKRVEEGLRSLEEFAKLLDPLIALKAKQLRYRLYELESHFARGGNVLRHRLAAAQLYVIVDGGQDENDFCCRCRAIVEAGAHIIQLRDKQLPDRQLWQRAESLREITEQKETLFIVNDRPDVALAVRADGVHVGQTELPVPVVRRLAGWDRLVGLSTHDLDQLHEAVSLGADYVGCGPTFPSPTKTFTEFAGLSFLEQATRTTSLVAFAIGGITLDNLPRVLATGIRRVAVSSAIWKADDPAEATRQFLKMLEPLPVSSPSTFHVAADEPEGNPTTR